jgi:hypothetical protein
MSIEIIKSQINKFLSSKEPEVMAIKGSWGIGKTYSWKKFLKEAKDGKNIGLGMYSYISLFGINSLNEFKYSIFVNKIKRLEIGEDASIKSFTYNVNKTLNAVKEKSVKLSILDFISKAFSRNSVSNIAESIAFLSLSETIICIDDLERRSKGLELKDVLGLVSLLKEQKKCKVVLLLNDNNLSKEDLEDYTKYRDKVIDVELEFSPTASENIELAFKGTDYATEVLKESAIKLDIKNIRVLQQTERLVNLVVPYLTDYEKKLTHQVVHTLTLFAWCHYCHKSDNTHTPSLDYIIKVTNNAFYLAFEEASEEKNETEDQKAWKIIINNYGYNATDNLDLLLSKVIQTGYIIESEIKEKAEEKNREIIAYKAGDSYLNAWDLFKNSFDDNTDEFINVLCEKIRLNIKYITTSNLEESVWVLKELGENEKAEKIIEFFIESRKEEINLFNIDEFNSFGRKVDSSIKDRFASAYQLYVIQETAEQVLARISGKNGWNQEDIVILSNTSIDQYYNLFKSINDSKRLKDFIRTCLQFGKSSNADNEYKEITNRATEALKRIARESKINEVRLKRYGITLDDSQQNDNITTD